jgi:phosphohistidine phosphatase
VRPLTPEGAKRFRRAARGLRRIVPEVELVLSSPYTRAWDTAVILHEEAGWPPPERCVALEAVRGPVDVVEALREQGDRGSAALVGHEPQLSSLASLLVAGDAHVVMFDKKKGGVAFLSFPGYPAPGEAVLRWWVPPKILRSLDA